jgi:hypothetical protein
MCVPEKKNFDRLSYPQDPNLMERISSEVGTDCCKESSSGPLLDSTDENEETKETVKSDLSCGDSDHPEYVSNLKRVTRKKESVVRFAPDTKPESKPRIGPPRAKPIPHNPRKVGRANLQRDIPFFLVFILILMIMALASQSLVRKKEVNTIFKSAANVKNNNIRNSRRTNSFSSRKAQQAITVSTSQLTPTQQQERNELQDRDNPLAKAITESTDSFPTTAIKSTLITSSSLTSSSSIPLDHHPHCRLFLGESSIPSASLSWFAGKRYDVGDVIFSSPLKIKNSEDKDNEQECHFRTLTPDVVQLHDHELFLKHHPTLANLEHRLNPSYPDHYDYVAIRTISPGDELWIHVEHHPHRHLGVSHPYYRNIPTPKDYFLAELVVEQMILVSRSCVLPCRKSDFFDGTLGNLSLCEDKRVYCSRMKYCSHSISSSLSHFFSLPF